MATASPVQSPDRPGKVSGGGIVQIETEILDALMNLVGELVLTRNQVLQFKSQLKDPAFHATTQRLNHITSELQEKLMRSRMQPIGSIWNSVPAMVRELAATLGKQIRVELSGSETELERSLVDAIRGPLIHLLRNAVEHGVESPDQRVAHGKAAEGRIRLRAYHEAGLVNLEISDDGGGICCNRVKARAVQSGLIHSGEAEAMGDAEAVNLVFLPGFSKADAVVGNTGLDVVKTHVERLGGTVTLQSNPGQGTTLRIQIPLTLAIIPALMVECGGEVLAIPQSSLLELVRLNGNRADAPSPSGATIEFVHHSPVFRLRGQLLPLLDLRRELALTAASAWEQPECLAENLVILEADGRTFGMVVDRVYDTEEIVVKPLGRLFQSAPAYAGATILGTGRVALILDIHGLAHGAGLFRNELQIGTTQETHSRPGIENDETGRELLIFEASPGRRMAIPLSVVSRLEEIQRTAIEHAGAREVLHYRGTILPLFRPPGPAFGRFEDDTEATTMQVIVCQHDGLNAGLIVSSVRDVVHDSGVNARRQSADGRTDSVVLQDKVTDLLDVDTFLREPSLASTSHGIGSSREFHLQPGHVHE